MGRTAAAAAAAKDYNFVCELNIKVTIMVDGI